MGNSSSTCAPGDDRDFGIQNSGRILINRRMSDGRYCNWCTRAPKLEVGGRKDWKLERVIQHAGDHVDW